MKYYIGIDGGGTSTKISLADEKKNIIKQFKAGAFNLNGQSATQTLATIKQIADLLRAEGYEASACEGAGIGAAGISNPEVEPFLSKAFASEGFLCGIELFGDHQTAMAAACPDCHGIILIAGTGSICYGINESGMEARAGGWGHIIDDRGSAYAIGRDILAAVVRAYDGREAQTALTKAVFDKLGICSLKYDKLKIEEMIRYIHAPERSKKDIGEFALLLEDAAACRDEAALRIEKTCADSLEELLIAVAFRLPEEKTVVLAGSVLEKNERIRRHLIKRMEQFEVRTACQDASEGALRLLWKRKGESDGQIFSN